MLENQAIGKMGMLDDEELKRCTRQAYFRSRRRLFKACQGELKRRGITGVTV